MKIKNGFVLNEVAGNNIVVGVGEKSNSLGGMITLNSSGAFISLRRGEIRLNDEGSRRCGAGTMFGGINQNKWLTVKRMLRH